MKINDFERGGMFIMVAYSITLAIFSTFSQFEWFSYLIAAGFYVSISLFINLLKSKK